MTSEIYVTFCIASFEFEPNEITAKTGVIPTRMARIGEPISAAAKVKSPVNAKIKATRWEVKSELDPSAELEAHFMSLIKRLQPGWSALVELGTQYGAMFTCVVWDYNNERPAIYFAQSIIKCATELNAGIEVIVYD